MPEAAQGDEICPGLWKRDREKQDQWESIQGQVLVQTGELSHSRANQEGKTGKCGTGKKELEKGETAGESKGCIWKVEIQSAIFEWNTLGQRLDLGRSKLGQPPPLCRHSSPRLCYFITQQAFQGSIKTLCVIGMKTEAQEY